MKSLSKVMCSVLAFAVMVFGCCATTGLASEPLADGAASVTYYDHRADFGYLDFPDGVAAVGFDLLSNQVPEMVDIRIYGFSGLIATTQAQANIPGIFFGVRSSEPIARIEYQAPSGSGEALDNLTFGTSAQIFQDGFESGDPSA